MPLTRTPRRVGLNFAVSATQQTEPAVEIGEYSGCCFVVPAPMNGMTLTVKTDTSGDTGFTVGATTGRVNLDSAQSLAFFPMNNLIVTTSGAVTAACTLTVLLKG